MRPQNPEAFAGTVTKNNPPDDLGEAEVVEVSPAYFDEVAKQRMEDAPNTAEDAEVIESSDEADVEEVDLSNPDAQKTYRADIKDLFVNRIERIGLEFYKLSESNKDIKDLLVDSTDIHSRARETYYALNEKLDFLEAVSDQGAEIPDELIHTIADLGEKLYDLNDALVEKYGALLKSKPDLKNVFDSDTEQEERVGEEGYSATEDSGVLDDVSSETVQPAPRASVMRTQLLAKLRGQGVGKKEASKQVEALVLELNSIRDLRERSARYHDVLQEISAGASETLGVGPESDAVDDTEEAEEPVQFGYDTEEAELESKEDSNTTSEETTDEIPVPEAHNEKSASTDEHEGSLDVEMKESTILGESSLEEDVPEASSNEVMPTEDEFVAMANKTEEENTRTNREQIRARYKELRAQYKSLVAAHYDATKGGEDALSEELSRVTKEYRQARKERYAVFEEKRKETGHDNSERFEHKAVDILILRAADERLDAKKEALKKHRPEVLKKAERALEFLKNNKKAVRVAGYAAVAGLAVAAAAPAGAAAATAAGATALSRKKLAGLAAAFTVPLAAMGGAGLYEKTFTRKRRAAVEANTESVYERRTDLDEWDVLEQNSFQVKDNLRKSERNKTIAAAAAGVGVATAVGAGTHEAVDAASSVSQMADDSVSASEELSKVTSPEVVDMSGDVDHDFMADNHETLQSDETKAAISGLEAAVNNNESRVDPGELFARVAEDPSLTEVVKDGVSENLGEALEGQGEEGTVVVSETAEVPSVPEPVTIEEGVAVPIAGENVVVDIDSIRYQLASGVTVSEDNVQEAISHYLKDFAPRSSDAVDADVIRGVLNDRFGTGDVSEPFSDLTFSGVTVDYIEAEAETPEPVETEDVVVPREPDALSVAEAEAVSPHEPEKAAVVEPEKAEAAEPEKPEPVVVEKVEPSSAVEYDLIPEGATYTWEAGDNFWDLAEGQTSGEQPRTFAQFEGQKLQEIIDLVRDHLEANPEEAKEIGFSDAGNLNLVFGGDSVNLHKLDEVAMQVAIDNNMFEDSVPATDVTESPRPVSRPEVTVETESGEVEPSIVTEPEAIESRESETGEIDEREQSESTDTSDIMYLEEQVKEVFAEDLAMLAPSQQEMVIDRVIDVIVDNEQARTTIGLDLTEEIQGQALNLEALRPLILDEVDDIAVAAPEVSSVEEALTSQQVRAFETNVSEQLERTTEFESYHRAFLCDMPYEQLSEFVNREIPQGVEEFEVTVTDMEGVEERIVIPVSFVTNVQSLMETLGQNVDNLSERLAVLNETLDADNIEDGVSLAMVLGSLEHDGLIEIANDGSVVLQQDGVSGKTILTLT